VPQIIASSTSGARIFNFNGGTLKAAANNVSFLVPGVASAANVRNGGTIIDTAGFNVTVGQALQHSAIGGDNATDGGLIKIGNGTLILSGANSYNGNTSVSEGTLELLQATLATSSIVGISNAAVLQLDFATTNTVAGLVLKGVAQPPGVYNGTTASPLITGPGSLLVPTAGYPTNLTFTFNSGSMTLSWPSDHLGWILQSATSLTSPVWLDLPSSASFTGTNITIDPAVMAEFFRLRHP
jgi:autotransporter-associated beta strand protein